MSDYQLARDARNRALRTFVQNLAVDVGVAVVLILLPLVQDANSFGDFEWNLIVFSVAKTVVLTVFSFVMRRFMDAGPLPTPLPPAPVPPPNEDRP